MATWGTGLGATVMKRERQRWRHRRGRVRVANGICMGDGAKRCGLEGGVASGAAMDKESRFAGICLGATPRGKMRGRLDGTRGTDAVAARQQARRDRMFERDREKPERYEREIVGNHHQPWKLRSGDDSKSVGSFENDRRRAVGEKRRDPFIEDPPFAARDQEGIEKDEEAAGGTGTLTVA